MDPEEVKDAKYLAIFQNNHEEFDEQIMSLEDTSELKKLEEFMMDCTDRGYYRCKIRDENSTMNAGQQCQST